VIKFVCDLILKYYFKIDTNSSHILLSCTLFLILPASKGVLSISKSAIPNINSIIRFETRSRMLNAQVSHGKWTVVTPLSENVTSTLSDVRDGDSHEPNVPSLKRGV
jgi:hypothetical protein